MNYLKCGDKVVCIRDDFNHEWHNSSKIQNLPVKGIIYTIEWIGLWDFKDAKKDVTYLFTELNNPAALWGSNPQYGLIPHPFSGRRFKPLTTKETDISVFTSLLTPTIKVKDREKELT